MCLGKEFNLACLLVSGMAGKAAKMWKFAILPLDGEEAPNAAFEIF